MASYAVRRAASDFKLLVTKLPWTVGTNELKEHFKKFGSLQKCAVFFNKDTGFSRSTGIVQFTKESSYNDALSAEHELDGKMVRVEPAEEESFRPRRNPTINRANLRRNMEDIMDSI